ncbi:MAG: carbohydrate-binding family 9-like protein [Bacteroidota bacterium]
MQRTVLMGMSLAFFLVAGCGNEVKAQSSVTLPHPRGYVAYKTPAPIVIDGILNDPAWRKASWTTNFVDIEGTLKPLPRFRTHAKMAWDDQYLYIGAHIDEPQVWATLTKRDTVIFFDNDFEVFIDPNGDHFEYYEFEMNALNTVWDLFLPKPYRDSGSAHNEWNIDGLKTAVHIRGTLNNPADIDSGWTVEIAMPWKALGKFAHKPAPPANGDQWRINFSRVEWKVKVDGDHYVKLKGLPEDNWVWSPQWVVDMHQPELWGYVQFSTAKPGTDRFRPDPTWEARVALYQVYKAEKAFRKEHGRYALTLQELGLQGRPGNPPVSIEPRAQGYLMTVHSGTVVLHETEDSRCWEEH